MRLWEPYRCVPVQERVQEEPELTYWRDADGHGYIHRRGNDGVDVRGGLGVDRALLRDAARSARHLTDAEIIQTLPPVPRQPGIVNWIRSL